MKYLRAIWNWFLDQYDGPPCPRHPGHRQEEYAPFGPDYPLRFCRWCYDEWEATYLADLHRKKKTPGL